MAGRLLQSDPTDSQRGWMELVVTLSQDTLAACAIRCNYDDACGPKTAEAASSGLPALSSLSLSLSPSLPLSVSQSV